MRRLLPATVALLLVLSYVAVSPSLALLGSTTVITSHGAIADPTQSGWLRTSGKLIVDENGNRVALRGANYLGTTIGELKSHTILDYQSMAEWGFNAVRLNILWSSIEPSPGQYDETYLAYVDREIKWATDNGIYVILDQMQSRWSEHFPKGDIKGRGEPVWMVATYPQTDEGLGTAIEDFWLGKAPNGTQPSPSNPSMQDRFINMWKYLSDRYKDEPTVIYDLLNEPPAPFTFKEGSLNNEQTADYLYPFYLRLIDSVREIDPNRMIIYEPVWSTSSFRLLDRPNLVFSFHFYVYADSYSGNFTELEKAFLDRRWNQPKSNPIKDWNIPIWVGEFGTDDDWPNSELWLRDILSIFNKYGVDSNGGWAYWIYQKSDSGLYALLYSDGTERTQFTEQLKGAATQPLS